MTTPEALLKDSARALGFDVARIARAKARNSDTLLDQGAAA